MAGQLVVELAAVLLFTGADTLLLEELLEELLEVLEIAVVVTTPARSMIGRLPLAL